MKSGTCGWRMKRSLGSRQVGAYVPTWHRGKPRLKGESTSGVSSYMTHVTDAASLDAYRRQEPDPLLSAEALPENASLIDFKAFAREYPEKLFLSGKFMVKYKQEFGKI
jgi:hypothetical protein